MVHRCRSAAFTDVLMRLSVVRNWIEKWRERKKVAAKHAAWRAELDRFGVWEVRLKLSQAGAGSFVYFASGGIEREFVEQWLSKKVEAAERKAAILAWARIAAWASLMAVFSHY
jgi:hypothetical protein